MPHRLRLLTPLFALILGLGLLAGCGGDDGGGGSSGGSDEDPQAVLEQTFQNDEMVESGVLDLSVNATAEGDQGGDVEFTLTGPFANNGEGELPTLNWGVRANADTPDQQLDLSAGVTITDDGQAFINYEDTDYEVDEGTLSALREQAEQKVPEDSGDQSLDQFGVDPTEWFSDLSNDGTEDVDGTQTIHVSGGLDVSKVVEDFVSIAEQTGQSASISDGDLDMVTEAVEEANFDVFTGADDKLLRKFDGQVTVTPPDGADSAGVDKVDLSFSVAVSDFGVDPEVGAPEDPRPLTELFGELGGLGALGGLDGPSDAPAAEAPKG